MTAERIKEMIDELFGDTSVAPEETLAELGDISEHLAILIECIEMDLGQ